MRHARATSPQALHPFTAASLRRMSHIFCIPRPTSQSLSSGSFCIQARSHHCSVPKPSVSALAKIFHAKAGRLIT